jgi:hypothetical protein
MKIILIALISVGLFSCVKELDHNAYRECHNSQNFDSSVISYKLVSTWKWEKQFCFSIGKTTKADKNIKVTFNADASFFVKENSTILTQGTWGLRGNIYNQWEIGRAPARRAR